MTVAAHIVPGNGKNRGNRLLQVHDAIPVRSDTLTASGSNQAFDIVAPDFTKNGDYVWTVENGSGGAIWVRFYQNDVSPTPEAAAGADYIVGDGQMRAWTCAPGERCAIINA